MRDNNYEEYYIKLNFQKGSRDPSRVFRGMSEYIDAFRLFDSTLIAPFNLDIQSHQELADIESGSIKAIIRRVLESVDDEALREGKWNLLLGRFLHEAKHSILDWCNKEEMINDIEIVEKKAKEISKLVSESNLHHIPIYGDFTPKALVTSVQSIIEASAHLTVNETIIYGTQNDATPIRTRPLFSDKLVEEVVSSEEIKNRFKAIVVIKRPDYLGDSKWQFRLNGMSIFAHILDEDWIKAFRNRAFEIKPGDGLRVIIEVSQKTDGTESTFEIVEVLGIVPGRAATQMEIDD